MKKIIFCFFFSIISLSYAKRALIFGITGQDGSYLAELLLEKDYEVHGVVRRSSVTKFDRIDHLLDAVTLHTGDLTDASFIMQLIISNQFDEIYNLAAQSDVKVSFENPEYTLLADTLGVSYILEAIRLSPYRDKIRFYQASTSEMFGKVQTVPQKESTPFYPRSPYGVAKLSAHWLTKNYRESYGLYACSGILFNHESPRRGEQFITKKVTKATAKIITQQQSCMYVGNLDAKRDWGYAPEYVEAMWLMLQQDKPEDFVIATGETHSVRELIEATFNYFSIKIIWQGSGLEEVGIDQETGKVLVRISPKYFRPSEVDLLIGDSSYAEKKLGWKAKTKFSELIEIMMGADLKKEQGGV